jgi:sarcosine oxidase delta subunit
MASQCPTCGSRSVVESEVDGRSADGERPSFRIDDATRQFRQLVLTHATATREEARRLQDRARELLRTCESNA